MGKVVDLAHGTHLSISALSAEFSMTRETIRKRLGDAGIAPTGKRGGYPVFRLRDVLPALMGGGDHIDPDQFDPYKRQAFYRGELDKLRLQTERRELIPRLESEREMAVLAKITAEFFDVLPDVLERDCALSPAVLAKLEDCLDKAREQLYQRLTEAEDDAGSTTGERG